MSNKTENRRITIWINDKEVVNSFAGIQKALRKSNNELRKMTRGSKEYNEKVKEVRGLNKHLAAHRKSIAGVNRSWMNLKTIMTGVIGASIIQGLFEKLTNFIPNLIKRNAELSDSFADVRKTTGLSVIGMRRLNKQLSKIETRTPRKKLLELARDAGKLGVTGVKNIAKFVESANKLDVALGEDLGEGAIRNIGKLNDVFGKTKQLGLSESMEATGSAINALGQASTANEGFIVGMTQRLSGMAAQAKISIEDTLGLSSATDQLGLKSEMASTAIGKTLIEMYKDTAAFAKIAGVSEKEFADQLSTDANGAFIMFLEGLNGNSEGLGVMANKLEEVGVEGARGTQVLASLATRTDILKDAQKLANIEYAKATSLTEEYNVKNNNLAGTLDKLNKIFNKKLANSSLKEGMEGFFANVTKWISVPAAEKINEERLATRSLITEAVTLGSTNKRRVEIIKELQEQYPQYLGNIDAEKVSNTQLLTVMGKINEQAIKRIYIEREKEKLLELQEDASDLLEPELKAKQEHADKLDVILNRMTAQQGDFFLRNRQNLSVELDLIKESSSSTAEQVTRLGLIFEQYNVTGIKPRDFLLLESYNNTYIEKLQERLAAEEIAEAKIQEINEKARMFGLSDDPVTTTADGEEIIPTPPGGLSDEQLADQAAKRQKFIDDKNAFEDEMYLAIQSAKDRELVAEMQKWDDLIGQAEAYGLDVTDLTLSRDLAIQKLEEDHQKSLADITEKANKKAAKDKKEQDESDLQKLKEQKEKEEAILDAKLMMYSSYASFLGAINDFIGKSGEEMTDFQKGLAVAQIAINTAVAIAENVKLAIAAASATAPNPGAPFLVAGYIAMGLASIFSGMNAAKNALAPADTPELETSKPPSYYKGTDDHPGGLAWVGEYGKELVELPAGSKVHTAQESRRIAETRMDTSAAISAIDGDADSNLSGESTFSSSALGSNASLSQLINSVNQVGRKLDSYEREKQITLSNSKFEEDKARIKQVKAMRNIG